jgi:putative Mn2+ efflux pump MntP
LLPVGEVFLLALSLALDAFAVSIGCGSNGSLKSRRESVRLAFHFGLFQFFMPIIGWTAGFLVKTYVVPIDHWIASSSWGSSGQKWYMNHAKKKPR